MSDCFDHGSEAFDRYLNGENDYEYFPQKKSCKYCGKKELMWGPTKDGWRLHDKNGDVHFCTTVHIHDIIQNGRKKK
jgi:hypothetical protein